MRELTTLSDSDMAQKPLIELLQNLYPDYSKEKLRALVDCREVKVNNETAVDYKQIYPTESTIAITKKQYVSRGGEKLEHALKNFSFEVENLVVIDAGSSTGGFTDALLQHGASAVHAVDVGYNLLDYKLRQDNRVIVHERQNIMKVANFDPVADVAVADLSFRSITKAAAHILSLTTKKEMIALIKPQFEVAKNSKGFSGVVQNSTLLKETLLKVYKDLALEGVIVTNLIESPIRGRKGNREFLAHLTKGESSSTVQQIIEKIESLLQP